MNKVKEMWYNNEYVIGCGKCTEFCYKPADMKNRMGSAFHALFRFSGAG